MLEQKVRDTILSLKDDDLAIFEAQDLLSELAEQRIQKVIHGPHYVKAAAIHAGGPAASMRKEDAVTRLRARSHRVFI